MDDEDIDKVLADYDMCSIVVTRVLCVNVFQKVCFLLDSELLIAGR